MSDRLTIPRVLFLVVLVLLFCAGTPALAATTQVHVVKYASDGTTILDETTVTYQWMQANLPVYGDGVTHYYHQGPVFIDDSDPAVEEQIRWDEYEYMNVLEKDYGAVMGTSVRDLCNLVGGMSPGEEVQIKAPDGFNKYFGYTNIYQPQSRQGEMIVAWKTDWDYDAATGFYPGPNYPDGMRIVFLADTSVNPYGVNCFGNWDMHGTMAEKYWHYYWGSQTEKYPTTTGLSVKWVSEILIFSNEPSPVPTPPTAQFMANITSGSAPLTVQFTDQSTGFPSSWAWDFSNDGSWDSTSQNPIYTFSSPGSYTVKLRVTNTDGSDSEIKSGYITVTVAPPMAQFTANTTSGTAPLTIQFTDQSTGSPTIWAWDFTNDGTRDSTKRNPTYTYTSPGTYTVNLTATNVGGSDSEVKTDYITVLKAPPELPPFPGCTMPPGDLDENNIYEDINGNGRLDFNDVVIYFHNMKWIENSELTHHFDYNGNSRIDFADVIWLFHEI